MDWYKHYAAKFNASTMHMSFAQRGCYITLLDCQWDRGGYLPDDEAAIFRMVGAVTSADQKVVRAVLAAKFDHTEDGYANRRMLKTVQEAERVRAKRASAGRASARARAVTSVQTHEPTEGGATRVRARRASLSLTSEGLDSSSGGESEGEGLRWRVLREFERMIGRAVSPGGCAYLDERIEEGATFEQCVAAIEAAKRRGGAIGTPNDIFNARAWNLLHGSRGNDTRAVMDDGITKDRAPETVLCGDCSERIPASEYVEHVRTECGTRLAAAGRTA